MDRIPLFRHEWWYLTGQLQGADGATFGFELTMFRLALRAAGSRLPPAAISAWRARQVYAAHFAITDVSRGALLQRDPLCTRCAGPCAARTAQPFAVHVADWSVLQVPDAPPPGCTGSCRRRTGTISCSWTCVPRQAPVLNGAMRA